MYPLFFPSSSYDLKFNFIAVLLFKLFSEQLIVFLIINESISKPRKDKKFFETSSENRVFIKSML